MGCCLCKKILFEFLVHKENATRIFVGNNITLEKRNKLAPYWYLGKYVKNVIKSNDILKNYLNDVVNGLMIYIGVYETGDYLQNKNQKFSGTDFFIDTKLLMRALGFSWDLEVESTRELLNMITKDYDGRICIFDHTLNEVKNAIFGASESIKKNKEIYDLELSTFIQLKRWDAFDFRRYHNSVRDIITSELGIKIYGSTDWNKDESRTHNLDWNNLFTYIQSKQSWNDNV